jgi:hypothetical protein
MIEKIRPIKNTCCSSSFLKYKEFYGIHGDMSGHHKNDKISNQNQSRKYSKSHKHINRNLSLIKFMENQDKKHLTTHFSHKEVEKFLKEKDKAMEKIIIEDDLINNKENTIAKETNIAKDNNEKSVKFNNDINNIQGDNKSSHIVIFHGTFGKDEYNRVVNTAKPENHHHHHHHHKHHHLDNHNKEENKNSNEQEIKRDIN